MPIWRRPWAWCRHAQLSAADTNRFDEDSVSVREHCKTQNTRGSTHGKLLHTQRASLADNPHRHRRLSELQCQRVQHFFSGARHDLQHRRPSCELLHTRHGQHYVAVPERHPAGWCMVWHLPIVCSGAYQLLRQLFFAVCEPSSHANIHGTIRGLPDPAVVDTLRMGVLLKVEGCIVCGIKSGVG